MIKKQTIMITGATGNIGEGATIALAKLGAKVDKHTRIIRRFIKTQYMLFTISNSKDSTR